MEISTATHISDVLNISRSYIYKLVSKKNISIKKNNQGKYIWDKTALNKVKNYLDANQISYELSKKEKPLKTSTINNRRYLGNKYKLLSFIRQIVEENCENIATIADVFSGTGAVASAFSDKKIITNDLLYSNYISSLAWFSVGAYSESKVKKIIQEFNNIKSKENNYMRKNFANTFFSADTCSKIGIIRERIENYYKSKKINQKEYAMLITSLLYAMDKIANTVGHYDAYRKKSDFDKELELTLLLPEKKLSEDNLCFNMDANELVKNINVDLLYLDPPYNSRQYSDAYHLIENVARWQKPEVYGVARKMDRSKLKSEYCTKNATKAFEDLIMNSRAKYILLSYNNMGEKGDERSNAKISDKDIISILEKKGKVKIFSKKYKSFTTGKSDIKQNEERLFLCTCYDKEKPINSPLNYTGGKFKLLSQLLPLFPRDIDEFIDLFCGGCNVGINVSVKNVIFNDKKSELINMLKTFSKLSKKETFGIINEIIEKYGLSNTKKYGYKYYNCDSNNGLAEYNRKAYLKLRKDVNAMQNRNELYYLSLYVLIVYAFNNQMRFNKKGEFNLPVGKRDFNEKMKKKLENFLDEIGNSNYVFKNYDFRAFDFSKLTKNSFVYADPPYLITCASYNEQNGWNEKDEKDLLKLLNFIHKKGARFALSNVLKSKEKMNKILWEWINKNNYNVYYLNHSYSNSNYQRKKKESLSEEVLITNYIVGGE